MRHTIIVVAVIMLLMATLITVNAIVTNKFTDDNTSSGNISGSSKPTQKTINLSSDFNISVANITLTGRNSSNINGSSPPFFSFTESYAPLVQNSGFVDAFFVNENYIYVVGGNICRLFNRTNGTEIWNLSNDGCAANDNDEFQQVAGNDIHIYVGSTGNGVIPIGIDVFNINGSYNTTLKDKRAGSGRDPHTVWADNTDLFFVTGGQIVSYYTNLTPRNNATDVCEEEQTYSEGLHIWVDAYRVYLSCPRNSGSSLANLLIFNRTTLVLLNNITNLNGEKPAGGGVYSDGEFVYVARDSRLGNEDIETRGISVINISDHLNNWTVRFNGVASTMSVTADNQFIYYSRSITSPTVYNVIAINKTSIVTQSVGTIFILRANFTIITSSGIVDIFRINQFLYYKITAGASTNVTFVKVEDFPQLTIDTGNDNVIDYTNTSLNKTVFVNLNHTAINNYITANCPFGWCNVPINFSTTTGILEYTLLNISYTDAAPRNFNNLTNTTAPKRNEYIHFNTNVSDGANLSSTTFGWNGTGIGFVNESVISFSTTTLNYSFSLDNRTNLSRGSRVVWRQYTNDSAGNWNVTQMVFNIANTVPALPTATPSSLSNVSTANAALTCGGGDVDNDTLNYEFYADSVTNPPTTLRQNTTGTSLSQAVTSGNWFFRCRSHDTVDTSSYTTAVEVYVDNIAPSFNTTVSNFSGNSYGANVSFGTKLNDDGGLSHARLADNQSGGFINYSLTTIGYDVNATFNWSIRINSTRGKNICGMFWANDTLGNPNTTTSCFTVNFSLPMINNLSISPAPANITNLSGIFSVSNVDNVSSEFDVLISNETEWFVNGERVLTAVNSTSLKSNNVTSSDSVIFSARSKWNFSTSNWQNSSTLVIEDDTPPTIPSFLVNASSILTTETLNFTINATDASSNIQTINFSLITPTGILDRSLTCPSGQKSVNCSYQLFAGSETATAGTYNISAVRVVDSSNNINTTTITTINFTLTTPSGGGDGGIGGGGGSKDEGCQEGYAKVNNTCVPVTNLTKAPQCGDSFCDAFAGEDFIRCPKDCQFESKFFTCSDPNKPCFFQNQNYVVYTILAILGGGLLYLSVAKNAKTKEFFRNIKKKVFRR